MAITANQAQGLVLALFGASAGGHLTSLSAASSVAVLAADLATSAGLILGKDLSSNTAFRDHVLTSSLKLTGAALTAAQTWMDGEFTKGTARGDILTAAVTYLDGLTDTSSVFYAAASSYRDTVKAAVTWSQGAGATTYGVSALRAQQGNTDVVAGNTFTLTTSAAGDSIVGTAGNDVITATGTTYDANDTIVDASTSDNDTLSISLTANEADTPLVQNIENVNLNANTFGDVSFDAAKVKGTNLITVAQSQLNSTGVAAVNNIVSKTNVTAGSGVTQLTAAYAVDNTTKVGSSGATVTGAGTVLVTGVDHTGVTVNISASGTTQSVSVTGAGHTTNGKADDAATVVGSGKVAVTNVVGTNEVENLTLKAGSAAATFTVTGATTKIIAAGSQDVTVKVTADAITGKTVTDATTAGTTTTEVGTAFTVTNNADTVDLSKAATDKILLSVDVIGNNPGNGDNVQVASGANVDITATQQAPVLVKVTSTVAANTVNVATVTKAGAAADASYTIAKIGQAKAINLTVGETTTVTTFDADAEVVATGSEALTLGTSVAAKSVDASGMTGAVTGYIQSNLLSLKTGAGKDTIWADDSEFTIDGGSGNDTLKFTATTDANANNDAVTIDLSDNTKVSIAGIEALSIDDDGDSNVTLIFAGSQVTGSNWAVKGELHTAAKDTVKVIMDSATADLSGWAVDSSTLNAVIIDGANAISNSAATTEAQIIKGTGIADTITAGNNGSTITAGAGADNVTGGSGADSIDSGSGDDVVDGGAGNDVLNGGTGADKLTGNSGNDTINGGDDADHISGGSGTDTLHGDAGADTISGGDGADTISGGAGNDLLVGGAGADVLNGGAGFDKFAFASQGTAAVDTGVVTIAGTYVAGEVVTVDDGGVVLATYTVKAGDTAADIASGLAADADVDLVNGETTKITGVGNGVAIDGSAITGLANTDSGVSVSGTTVSGFDKITDFTASEDSIYLGGLNAIAGVAAAAPTAATTVKISATGGKVTFAAEDDTFAEMIAALVADGTNVDDNEVAIFEFGGNTYVYGAGTNDGGTTDFLIELTGVTGLGVASISSGLLTFAA